MGLLILDLNIRSKILIVMSDTGFIEFQIMGLLSDTGKTFLGVMYISLKVY